MKRVFFLFCALCLVFNLHAQFFKRTESYIDLHRQEKSLALPVKAAALLDANSNSLLYLQNAEEALATASLAKVATLYLSLLKTDFLGLGDRQLIGIRQAGSFQTQKTGAVLFGLRLNEEWPLFVLLEASASISAADTTYALADYFGPGIVSFVEQLNALAQLSGTLHTFFDDPDGWSVATRASALDLLHLTTAYLRAYPDALIKYHSNREITTNLGTVRANTNRLLGKYQGADGVKSGFTHEAGFNMISSAVRQGRRLIAVIMGVQAASVSEGLRLRAELSEQLLDYGFSYFSSSSLEQLADLEVTTKEGKSRWELVLKEKLWLSSYQESLPEQSYKLRFLEHITEKEGVASLTFFDEKHRFIKRVHATLHALDGTANLTGLKHQGSLFELLRAEPLQLNLVNLASD